MSKSKKTNIANKLGFRSGFEVDVNKQILSLGIDPEYEKFKIRYSKPATLHTYTPDFKLPNGVIIETKGRFILSDRKKHLLIQEQHPELDIRFVFQNPRVKINKSSRTTYADWCDKNGFQYSEKTIPLSWFK